MENVSIPVSGEKYVWVKNKDVSGGKVVLRTSSLLGMGITPMVVTDSTVEGYINDLSDSSDMFLSPESVEEWGYDLREYSAYTLEEAKYVWYTTSASRRYALYKQGRDISMVMLDNGVDASALVGDDSYMLSEAEVDNSVYDADKFTTVGKNGVRGPKGKVESHKVNYTRYQLSDKFKEARAKGMVYIPVKTEDEASILRTVINTKNGYSDGFDGMLLVYSTRDARFRPLYKYANAKEMSVEEVVELAPTSTPTRKPKYKMSDKFDKLHSEDIVVITIANKEEADILASLLPIDCEYHVGDSDEDTSDSLLVYPEQTGYGADFTTLERHFGNPIITFAEAVVEIAPATFSTDGDASDVISAPYVTANGTALDLSHTPIGTDSLPSAGFTSAKINLVWYKTTDKFKEALRKGTVFIPVENDKEAAILSSIMEIDLSHMYRPEYKGGTLIASEGVPARFSPFINYPNGTRLAFEDAVEEDSTTPYTSF